MAVLKLQFSEEDRVLLDTEVQTELTLQELLTLLPTLTQSKKKNTSPGRYGPLTDHLLQQTANKVTLGFTVIEKLLGFSLPASARKHRAWWGNHENGHTQARGWLQAGWTVEKVDLAGEEITFQKEE